MNILIDLFDHSGNCAEPYRINNWHVLQVDIKNGIDILTWDYKDALFSVISDLKQIYPDRQPRIGLLAAIPCTNYSLSGAKHFAAKDADGRTDESQLLVDKTREIKEWVDSCFGLLFWKAENPMSRIHKLNPWLGNVEFKFNPCDFAGYLGIPDTDRYNKQTWLWGKFNHPVKKRVEPIYKENPGWKLLGGKSERTKELRSIDPKGFCQAFYEANH